MRSGPFTARLAVLALLTLAASVVATREAAPAGALCGCTAAGGRVVEPDAVFQGTLVAAVDATATPGVATPGPPTLDYTFHVERVLQGAVADTIVVRAAQDAETCDALVVGRRYEVRTRVTDTGLEVAGCADGPAIDSDVLALRRNGSPITAVDGPDHFLVLGLAGLGVIVGIAVTVLAVDHVRRARRRSEDGTGPPERPAAPLARGRRS
jgi:hypothetical protein